LIRVFIADDHSMVREGFRRIIDGHPDMAIVAEAADGIELLECLQSTPADVLVLDISMPGPGFLEVMEALHGEYPRLPVLVVSMHPEEHWATRAFQSGAAGYLTKAHSAEELAEAIRRVHQGGRYVTPGLAEHLASQLGPGAGKAGHEALSRREYEVLCLLGSGKMVKGVAHHLGLSPKTVSTYRSRILEKLALRTTADLIRYVVENDLEL
jgi:two-component system invasion response regulator UvrY